MLTKEQVKQAFDWIRQQVLPPEKLKIELGDKEFAAGFLAGYKSCYGGIRSAESEYLARIGLAEKHRSK